MPQESLSFWRELNYQVGINAITKIPQSYVHWSVFSSLGSLIHGIFVQRISMAMQPLNRQQRSEAIIATINRNRTEYRNKS